MVRMSQSLHQLPHREGLLSQTLHHGRNSLLQKTSSLHPKPSLNQQRYLHLPVPTRKTIQSKPGLCLSWIRRARRKKALWVLGMELSSLLVKQIRYVSGFISFPRDLQSFLDSRTEMANCYNCFRLAGQVQAHQIGLPVWRVLTICIKGTCRCHCTQIGKQSSSCHRSVSSILR